MKKRLLYILGIGLVFANCSKKLDELKPFTELTADLALQDADGVKKAVVGAYASMGAAAFYGSDVQMASDLLGGNGDVLWDGTFAAQAALLDKIIAPANGIATNTWITAYRTINAANKVIENVDKITVPAERNTAKGEALFLRAISHFELVRLYAQPWNATGSNDGLGVPLMLKSSDFSTVSRASIAQVYAQIIQDLTEAETLLPTTGKNNNRATAFVAKGYLARVYLQQSNFAQALAKANEVITSGGFTLGATVTDVFDNDGTAEAIFELQQTAVNNAGTLNGGLATYYSNTSSFGRGDMPIQEGHLLLYEAGDDRRSELFYVGDSPDKAGAVACAKWWNAEKNYCLMRLSEMILIRAECNFRLSSATGATPLADVNTIRSRATLSNLVTVDLPAILKERQLELCFEGHRLHDIKRLKQNVVSTSPAFNYAFDSPKLVLPIPFREIVANPNLVQNPGY